MKATFVAYNPSDMTIPSDRKTVESEIMHCWLEDDLLIFWEKPVRATLENISRHRELVDELTNGRRLPLLIYLKATPRPDRETRLEAAKGLVKHYTAIALVSSPELATEMIRLFYLDQTDIPVQNFTDDWAAKEWLKQFKSGKKPLARDGNPA